MQELEAFGEEEVRVDENHLDLVEEARLSDGVEDDAVARDEGRSEERVLLVLWRRWLNQGKYQGVGGARGGG